MLSALRASAPLILLGIIPHPRLTEATVNAFDQYVRGREAAIERQIAADKFLWAEQKPERLSLLRSAGVVIEPLAGNGVSEAGDGVVHDWLGAAFLPGATLERTLIFVQDYNSHKFSYAPEVVDSKLLRREGDFFKVYLRLRKHKIITVVLDTEYDVTYRRLSPTRVASRSYSTRIAEIEGSGPLKPGEDHGFLWRLDTFWRFEERDGGVYMEVEAISLTRNVPRVVSPIVTPIVRQLPRESLEKTLLNTRRALAAH